MPKNGVPSAGASTGKGAGDDLAGANPDDAGQPLPRGHRLDARAARRLGIDEATYEAATWNAKRQAQEQGQQAILTIVFLATIATAVNNEFDSRAFAIAMGCTVCLLALTLNVRKRRCFFALQRAAWLSRGLCPACGASVAGLPTREDGCRVCAGCQAAWKVEPGTITAPVRPCNLPAAPPGNAARAFFYSPPIVDDRGQPYTLHRSIPKRAARAQGIDRRRIRDAMGTDMPELWMMMGGYMVFVLLLLYAKREGPLLVPQTLVLYMAVGVLFLSLVLPYFLLRPWSAKVRRCASRRLCLCAACGRRLDTIEPQEDGRRVCAGCQAAWKIEAPACATPS
ncbi:MAG: hypothetical protein KIT54_07955 [Phycisphaeraceae bacterium]|nr:hypothetical protein [Phycisphaeraceae bacterium]